MFLKLVCLMTMFLKGGGVAGELTKRLLRSGQSVLMEAPTTTFDASIPEACFDHNSECSSSIDTTYVDDDLNLLAKVVERYNAGIIGNQRFLDELCAAGNVLREILKTFKCVQSGLDLIQEVVPAVDTLRLDNSTRSIDLAVAFARDLLERVPSIEDSGVLNEDVFVMSFASVMQKMFHGIVPYVKNAYEIADMFRVSVNRITRPGFVLFRKDTDDRAGRVLYPLVDSATSAHKILIFSTLRNTATTEPDVLEYHAALNALLSGRPDLIAPYLSLDDIQSIYYQ